MAESYIYFGEHSGTTIPTKPQTQEDINLYVTPTVNSTNPIVESEPNAYEPKIFTLS